MTTLRAGTATDVGRIRPHNEDSSTMIEGASLYVVADGMGGHQGGEVASALAVQTVEAGADQEPSLETLKESVRLANRAIFEKAGSDPDLHGMGTTACAIRVVPGPEGDEIAWVNVGDSRIYLQRDGKLIQLSRDHSLVEDLLRSGQLTPEEAAVHPKRNILTRALGIDIDVEVDGGTVMPFNGDRFLLCSDGLFNEVSEDQIAAVLRRLADPSEAADELVRQANEGGGRDNITVVLVDVVDDGGRSEAASALLAGSDSTVGSVAPEPSTAIPVAEPTPAPTPPVAKAAPVFAGQRSSLPEADDDYGAEKDDLFGDLGHARTRRITGRVVVFLLALVLVAVVVVGAIIWSGRNTYYVGVKGDRVALYKGNPDGGFLHSSSLQQTTQIEVADLPQALQATVHDGKEFGSQSAANRYLLYLTDQVEPTTTTTTTASTTTTTAVGGTTTAPGTPTTTTVLGG